MGFLEKLFKKNEKEIVVKNKSSKDDFSHEWQDLPKYLLADKEDVELVSILASAIAANDQPESTFVIRNIYKRNQEIDTLSVIATSIAANDRPESTFVVKSIKEKK